jgi:excisionase family DNA binding protein
MNCNNDEALWRVRDACNFLQCSQSYLYKIARSGDLKSIKIGNYWRFQPEDIREWVVRHRNESLQD